MTDFSVLRSRLTGTLTTPDDTVGVDAQRTTALSRHRGRSSRLVRQIGFALPRSRGTPDFETQVAQNPARRPS